MDSTSTLVLGRWIHHPMPLRSGSYLAGNRMRVHRIPSYWILIVALLNSGWFRVRIRAFAPLAAVPQRPSTSLLASSNPGEQDLRSAASRNVISNYETFGDAALSNETFRELYGQALPTWLTSRCHECGWIYPTLVQRRALDSILEGQDVLIQSQTGSGKTLAFLLPILADMDSSRAAVQAMIVVPTRELGLQVARVAKRLVAASSSMTTDAKKKIMVMSVLQGSQNKRQRAWAWAEPPHVVIGTPEELTNMVKHGGIRYNSVKYVVVDEVDACLLNNAGTMSSDLASSGPLHELLSRHLSPTFELPDRTDDLPLANVKEGRSTRPMSQLRQTIFSSATIPQHRHFLKLCAQNKWTMKEPVHVHASPGELLPPTLHHTYLVCSSQEKKFAALRGLLRKLPDRNKVLVFCEPNRPMEEMAQVLASDWEGGVYWKEGCGSEHECTATAIVSVLRYEDNLSKRASAMLGFRGSSGGSIEGRRFEDHAAHGDGIVRVLFASDLAARGLDVVDISHVIHFDLPRDASTYLHRAGRAGRLGRRGMVVTILTPDQEFVLERLGNSLSLDMKCIGRQQQKR